MAATPRLKRPPSVPRARFPAGRPSAGPRLLMAGSTFLVCGRGRGLRLALGALAAWWLIGQVLLWRVTRAATPVPPAIRDVFLGLSGQAGEPFSC